jgi:hypothetical protein
MKYGTCVASRLSPFANAQQASCCGLWFVAVQGSLNLKLSSVHSGCTSPQSRYMFALCCMKLGKHIEAEKALQTDDKQVHCQEVRGSIGKRHPSLPSSRFDWHASLDTIV